jgi:hypothetical protein
MSVVCGFFNDNEKMSKRWSILTVELDRGPTPSCRSTWGDTCHFNNRQIQTLDRRTAVARRPRSIS